MVRPVYYLQTDARWKSNSYAVDGETSTIGSAGCGPTSMAMVLASIVNPYIDPLTTASWSRMKGYKVYKSGTSYNYFEKQGKAYGVTVKRLTTSSIYHQPNNAIHEQVKQALINGNWVIACMGKGLWTSSGHYIVVYGYDNGKVYINDSASTKATRACNTWNTFKNEVKQYFVVEVPDNIKKNGNIKYGAYNKDDFVREVQMTLKTKIDGKAGSLTLAKTVSVSSKKNKTHNVVYPLQKFFKNYGYYNSTLDKKCGPGMTAAINRYQKEILKYTKLDGEITAKGKMWKSILSIK